LSAKSFFPEVSKNRCDIEAVRHCSRPARDGDEYLPAAQTRSNTSHHISGGMALARRGRKAVKPSIPMSLWLMVELARDRRRWGRPRASAREAAHRVAEELAECFQGGRELPPETVRRYHKEFDRVMRRGGDEAELGKRVLDNARQRRDLLGWETSTWLLVFNLLIVFDHDLNC
jgi:hypothetical protein